MEREKALAVEQVKSHDYGPRGAIKRLATARFLLPGFPNSLDREGNNKDG
jgi:hypothetical protein